MKMDSEGRERFGAYLRSLREGRGLTQRQAGEAAKVSGPYLAQVERGQRNPPNSDMLCRLARVYEVAEQHLLQEAGYLEGGYDTIPDSVIERAFDFVSRDENYAYGTRLEKNELTLAAKAFIVEVYQKATGRILLKEEELNKIYRDEDQDAHSETNAY
jgi:transcriptional regulator with XRE-family HTH domain